MFPLLSRGARILVIGAGMAGLTAADDLVRRGYDPLILEARTRVGGRIHTLRDWAPGLIAEAGAMRIPRRHSLTLGLVRRFGLEARPLAPGARNTVFARERLSGPGEPTPFEADPSFPLSPHERALGVHRLWEHTVREVRAEYRELSPREFVRRYDRYSLREFLRSRGWSEAAIEQYGVVSFTESTLNTSVIQEFRESFDDLYGDLLELPAGMDSLPRAFLPELGARLRLGTEVLSIGQDGRGVRVRARTAGGEREFSAEALICTLPFSVLRGIELNPVFSAGKMRAIRQLHYDAATKIFLQFRSPLWQERVGQGGGATATDLPVRRIQYPAHTVGPGRRALLLASYTWGQDALQWGALEPEDRVRRALLDITQVHPGAAAECEYGASYAWSNDRFSMGAYALTEPGQLTALQDDVLGEEGRIFFAGDHCSRLPAWIEGAVESGLAAAAAVARPA